MRLENCTLVANPFILIDNFKHQGLRKQLVQELKNKGISDPEVLNAIMAVPRHVFMDNAFLQFAYEDKAFPIGKDKPFHSLIP